MDNSLYIFVGKSASGKTTIASMFEESGEHKSVSSYTTRPPRYDGETGHAFVFDEEFNRLENIVAYTEYNNYRYCSTKEQIDSADIYVVDVPGVDTLLQKYDSDRHIIVFYFDTDVRTRIDRMIERNDCDAAIVSRLHNDEESDWLQELNKLVWHYKNNVGRNVDMCVIDATKDIDVVFNQVASYIQKETE